MATNRFFPRFSEINAITNALNAVVTFTADHDFLVGEIVSFRVTPDFGMFEIDKKRAKVIAITSDTITIDVDTSTWDIFDISLLNTKGTTPPVCVPCCSGVIPSSEPKTVILEDAFDNRRV